MENLLLSDIEEGEILEHDLDSPKNTEIKNDIYNFQDEFNGQNNITNGGYVTMPGLKVEGYVNEKLKRKLNLNYDKPIQPNKLNHKQENFLLDFISSEDEFKSDEEKGNSFALAYSKEKEKRKNILSGSARGTAEDIMSEIDQVVCRKSYYSNKRKRYQDIKYNWEKLYKSKSSSGLKFQEVFSDGIPVIKSRKHVSCKICSVDSNAEKIFTNELSKKKCSNSRRKRIKYDDYYRGHFKGKKNSKATTINANKEMRDFDEVRKNLLEQLKKKEQMKEASEKLSKSNSACKINIESSPGGGSEIIISEKLPETCGDEEMDLTQLRLIALASNKKKKKLECGEQNLQEIQKTLGNVDVCESLESKSKYDGCTEKNKEDIEFDRNELLLRAEALKTALLKKHQKRLNKLKANKINHVGSSSDNDPITSCSSGSNMLQILENNEKSSELVNLDNTASKEFESIPEDDGFKENVNKENGIEITTQQIDDSEQFSDFHEEKNDEAVKTCNSKKKCFKNKSKRKKKKSLSFFNSVKENSAQVNHSLEEDCRSLRSQLLCDLIKKKSIKFLEKKTVLMDTMQKSVSKPVDKSNNNVSPLCIKPAISISNSNRNLNNFQPPKYISLKKIPEPQIQRVIVHLGSEDSSDDDANDNIIKEQSSQNTFAASENHKVVPLTNSVGTLDGINESVKVIDEKHNILNASLNKIQEKIQKTKNNETVTPEAIYKHLPPSQRLEYIRLKRKIAERERLKRFKNGISADMPSGTSQPKTSNFINKKLNDRTSFENCESKVTALVPPTPVSRAIENKAVLPTSFSKANNFVSVSNISKRMGNSTAFSSTSVFLPLKKYTCNKSNLDNPNIKTNTLDSKQSAKTSIKKCLVSSRNASKVIGAGSSLPFQNLPTPTLISKLKFLLKKIKIEKTVEENYDKEITKLKSQLILIEKKKNEQRFKIKKLAEESVKTYKLIQNITSTVHKTARELQEETLKVAPAIKENFSSKENSKEVENNEKMMEEGLQDKISKADNDALKELNANQNVLQANCEEKDVTSNAGELVQYNSPLDVFSQGSDKSERVDPNVIMCQFDLMGVCKDNECTYQHLRAT